LPGFLVLLVADLVHQVLPSHVVGRAELLPPLGDRLADFADICAQAHEVECRAESGLLHQAVGRGAAALVESRLHHPDRHVRRELLSRETLMRI
jgi:hypothetical protein